MNKGHDMLPDMSAGDGQTMIEIMIPGNKAGIIIGKGGETIKTLQVGNLIRRLIVRTFKVVRVPDVVVTHLSSLQFFCY